MANQLIVFLEHLKALLALVVKTWCPDDRRFFFRWGCVLVTLSGFLSGVLEPDSYDTRLQVECPAQIFQIIVFRIGVSVKVILKGFNLGKGEEETISQQDTVQTHSYNQSTVS